MQVLVRWLSFAVALVSFGAGVQAADAVSRVTPHVQHPASSAAMKTYVWTGAGANAKASTAGNWLVAGEVPETPPQTGDAVLFDATGDGKACTWDLDVALAAWTQDGYTSTVTIQTMFGSTGFTNLVITGDVNLKSGTWTHAANGSTETYRLRVTCGGNFTVGDGAEINADAKGYNNAGPGRSDNHCGGSYGGYCDNFYNVTSYGRCYGSVASPENIGSSGCSKDRQGGGAIRLAVSGTLTVDGHVYARGHRTVQNYYSGSGGSVWLTAGKLVGAATGAISADAGLLGSNYAGAGGRISLCQTGEATDFSAYLGTVTADGAIINGGYCGSSGTVYWELKADGRGKGALVIDGRNASHRRSDFFIAEQDAGFSPKSITLKNGITLNVFGDGTKGNQTFVFGGKLVMDGTATFGVDKGATLDMRGMTTEMSSSGTHTFALGKDVTVVSDKQVTFEGLKANLNGTGLFWALDTLVCTNGGVLAVNAANTLDAGQLRVAKGGIVISDYPLELSGDVKIENGGTVTHSANTKSSDYRIDWTVGGDFTVEAGGAVDTRCKGYPYQIGPGTDGVSWMSGCHGGHGWSVTYSKPSGGVCYGSLTRPVTLGSGVNSSTVSPAAGGGAVKLTVAGAFVNGGAINADGGEAGSNTDYRSSPGGSVWITAKAVAGSGRITANAMGENTESRKGLNQLSGGGRVAVWLTQAGADFSNYTGPVTAFGARNASKAGGAGTVYLKKGSESADGGTLIVSNATTFASCETDISSSVTDLAVGTLVIAPGSAVKFADGRILSVSGDLTNEGTVSASADSGIEIAGSGTSTVAGDLTLGIFDCLTPGKTIVFTAGSTLSIVAGGRFKIDGAQDHPVTLKSTVDESDWNLSVDATAAAAVSVGAVSDCNASGGQKIAAVNSTLTRTQNWSNSIVVYGQLLTWTGGSGGTGWLTAANWDAGRAPIATDRIYIPATPVQPVLGAEASSLDLTVGEGACLDLAGYSYTVAENLAVTGTVKSVGSPILTVNGNCDLTGSVFDADDLTLAVEGADGNVQKLKGGDATIARVALRPGSSGLDVSEGFTAFYLTAEADAARQIAFAPGTTVRARDVADFASSGSNLALVSKTAGQIWNLVLDGKATATGVAVSDSKVAGTILCATDSTDNGGNTNWDFGTLVPFHWTTTASSPSETDTAYVDSTLTAATGNLTVRALTLKSGAAFTLPKKATLTVTEALIVEDGATATLNGKVTVGGSCLVASGATLTHSQSSDTKTVYTIDMSVGVDFVLDAGGAIALTGKGYAASVGPGAGHGGSHAGRGETHNTTKDYETYGSALWPVKPGSGGSNTAGGGAVQLKVEGVARINGDVTAKGADHGAYYTGAGGSIAVRACALIGSGSFVADGGDIGSSYTGAGGRVAVILTGTGATVDRFKGTIQAYSGKIASAAVPYPQGSAGTIYFEEASDGAGCGRVIVDNSANGAGYTWYTKGKPYGFPRTDYPVMNDETVAKNESKNVTWTLKNTVALNITKDCKIGDLFLEGSKPKVYLNGHTLKINAHRHSLGESEAQIVPGGTAENPGKIVWKQGFSIIVR